MKLTSRKMLAFACAFSVLAASAARLGAAGWFMLLGIWVYPVVLIGHCIVHIYCMLDPRVSRRGAKLLLASDATLLAAFLLQWDMGDDFGWLTITRLYRVMVGGRFGSEEFSLGLGDFGHLAYDAVLLVPIFVLWVAAVREAMRTAHGGTRTCLYCGYQLTSNASGVCPECGTQVGQQRPEQAMPPKPTREFSYAEWPPE